MKRILSLLTVLIVLCTFNAYAADEVEIYIDNEKLECEDAPVNVNDRVLVPMRSIFEALDATVSWNGQTRTVKAEKDSEFIYLTIDSNTMSVGVYNSNGEAAVTDGVYLDVPSTIINDRTFVPIRAVSEALHTTVSWDGENNRVIIDSGTMADGVVYFTSKADGGRVYSVEKNGSNRQPLSSGSASELEMYDGDVYYVSDSNHYIYKANASIGEDYIINTPVNKLGIDVDGWLYYQELDTGYEERGSIFKYNLGTGETIQLVTDDATNALKYKNYIYYNIDNDNNMYALETDSGAVTTVTLGDGKYAKLYPFNCVFFDDNILVENGMWYGSIMKMNLDGSGVQRLTDLNSIICKSITTGDKIVYIYPNEGQDIYCMNLDGSDKHKVLDADSYWLGMEVLARYENTLYYKNPMRNEVYRVNLDGSDNAYVCYAENVEVIDGTLFASADGLYVGGVTGNDLAVIYDKAIEDFCVADDVIYVKDKGSSRLYMTDINGNKQVITADGVGEWICE